jgi:hypothetical protein
MYMIRARAYTRDPVVPRSNKLQPRALISYLVGYVASNIWKIWIPSKQTIKVARDVIFDKDSLYDPTQPFMTDLLRTTSPFPPIKVVPEPDVSNVFNDIPIEAIDNLWRPYEAAEDEGQAQPESEEAVEVGQQAND